MSQIVVHMRRDSEQAGNPRETVTVTKDAVFGSTQCHGNGPTPNNCNGGATHCNNDEYYGGSQGSAHAKRCFYNSNCGGGQGFARCVDSTNANVRGPFWTKRPCSCGEQKKKGGCFPAGTKIRVSKSGESKNVVDVHPPLKVYTPFGKSGATNGGNDVVYYVGHAMVREQGDTEYVEIETTTHHKKVAASSNHFIGIVDYKKRECALDVDGTWDEARYKKCVRYVAFEDFAKKLGEEEQYVFVVIGDGEMRIDMVNWNKTRVFFADNMYDPVTFSGIVVANDVVVSAHTTWSNGPLVSWYPREWWHTMPFVYQTLFAPLRLLARIFPSLPGKVAEQLPLGVGEYAPSRVALEIVRGIMQDVFQRTGGPLGFY